MDYQRDRYFLVRMQEGESEERSTHRKPIEKTHEINIFLLEVICNLRIHGIGRIRIAKSVITLKTPVALYIMSLL